MSVQSTYLSCLLGLVLSTYLFTIDPINAQEAPLDSTKHEPEQVKEKKPLKATLFSAVVPGAGQIYNGGWHIVKVPIMYGGFAALIYAIDFNKENYLDFKTAHRRELLGLDHKYSDINISADGLRSQRDFYRKNLELSWIGMSVLYIVNVADAFVSAHLTSFDVSEDLSLRLKPYGELNGVNEQISGLTLSLNLH